MDGELDEAQVPAAREAAGAMLQQRHVVDFAVDLTRCPFVSSDGLELLLSLKTRCEEMQGRIVLCGCSDDVLKILEMTRLRSRFECAEDAEAALKQMRA